MEVTGQTTVKLELGADLVAVLQTIAEKQGLLKEQVAAEAIELWVEQYRCYGPAFSRRRVAQPAAEPATEPPN